MKRSGFIQLAARMLYTRFDISVVLKVKQASSKKHIMVRTDKGFLEISACNVNSRGRDTGNFSGTEKSFRSSIEKKKLSGEGFCGFPKVSGRGTGKLPESFFFSS